jgi:hypothetical protein
MHDDTVSRLLESKTPSPLAAVAPDEPLDEGAVDGRGVLLEQPAHRLVKQILVLAAAQKVTDHAFDM